MAYRRCWCLRPDRTEVSLGIPDLVLIPRLGPSSRAMVEWIRTLLNQGRRRAPFPEPGTDGPCPQRQVRENAALQPATLLRNGGARRAVPPNAVMEIWRHWDRRRTWGPCSYMITGSQRMSGHTVLRTTEMLTPLANREGGPLFPADPRWGTISHLDRPLRELRYQRTCR